MTSQLEETLAMHLRAAKLDPVREYQKTPTPNTNCKVCGTSFYASPGHTAKGWATTCSLKCRTLAKPNPRFIENDVLCKHCGTAFHVKPYQEKAGKGKVYCSNDCRIKATTIEKTCKQCKTTFTIPKSQANWSIYCSKQCRHDSALCRTPNCTCKTCGKEFYCKPYELKRSICAGTFCSAKCMTGSRGKVKLGDGKFASYLEVEMYAIIKNLNLDYGMTREFRFHEGRRWLFDFAWPDKKIGLEVHGGIWLGKSGAHTSDVGRARDMEKMNAAVMLGWRVLEVTAGHIRSGQAGKWVKVILAKVET